MGEGIGVMNFHVRAHFRPGRDLMSAPQWRTEMIDRFAVWGETIAAAAA